MSDELQGQRTEGLAARALEPLRIAFLHPTLGIGGAERLICDAAIELAQRGHRVVIYTGEHDAARSFLGGADTASEDRCDAGATAEARRGAARGKRLSGALEVRVRGRLLSLLPARRLRVPFNTLRMARLAAALARELPAIDVVVCDLVPHVIPFARRRLAAPIVYYGHYPDLLLAPRRLGWYRLYRAPIDRLEAVGLERADRLVVNSRFTAETFRRRFPALASREIEVLHPGVAVPAAAPATGGSCSRNTGDEGEIVLLAIGRIAPDKNLELAIASFGALRRRIPAELHARARLVVAGGYDAKPEARSTLERLRAVAREEGVADRVELRTSISEDERQSLLARCTCVVHPHPAEHFGIVPLEAMAAGRAVVAANRGGTVETIVDGETGFLREPDREAFAEALAQLLCDPQRAARMGSAGRERVASRFSRAAMGERLESLLYRVVAAAEAAVRER